jgi:uncharacterized glyoxalase superfamily protein PhnB
MSGVMDLKAFVPAKDHALSRRFYADLGFREVWGNDGMAEFELGGFRFLLQNYYVREFAENFMMQLRVESADQWWEHVAKAGLKEKYGLGIVKLPAMQPWGLRVMFLSDPTGVLWHIAEAPRS